MLMMLVHNRLVFLERGGGVMICNWRRVLEEQTGSLVNIRSNFPPDKFMEMRIRNPEQSFSPGCPGKPEDSWPASAGCCGCLWWPFSAGVLSASSPASARIPHSGTCVAFPAPGPAWCIQWPVRVRVAISLIWCTCASPIGGMCLQ